MNTLRGRSAADSDGGQKGVGPEHGPQPPAILHARRAGPCRVRCRSQPPPRRVRRTRWAIVR